MSTEREKIEKEYKVERDVIVSPGAFEGQPVYAPYFVTKAERRGKTMITIRAEDRVAFPELGPFKVVVVETAPNGKITVSALANADYF
jgi:hypothetical protein